MNKQLFEYTKPKPCFSLLFRVVPSWNDAMSTDGSSYNTLGAFKKKWRARGRARAVAVLREQEKAIVSIRRELRTVDKRTGMKKAEFFEGLEEPLFKESVAVIVRLWRPTAAAYDVHNLVIKPIIDGFGDVRIFETDAVRGLPELGFCFEGVDPSLKLSREEIEERKRYFDGFRNAGRTPPRLPLPARILFDFYRCSRLKFGTIYQFETLD